MDAADFRTVHQGRALWLSTIAFTICFAVWTIFSIIGIRIKQELGLNDTQFGLLVGTPILSGSLIRLLLGIWTDQYGGRRVYTVVMLAAAVATYLLTWAHTYPEFLVAAFFVGIAGGSFAVGIAYVSRFYPAGKQGTALGIFGAGNVGAAVTKFVAPFVLVAYGWQTVAQVWALAIGLMGIAFWFFSEEDPVVRARREKNEKPTSAWLELEPLKNIQVWRFALYYFFVFGAFVALALWLPQYLIKVYGVDIKTAGMVAAMFSLPASVFRAYGGHLSDRFGARRVMYWTFLVGVAATFVLSYPPTDYLVKTVNGTVGFHLEMGLVPFTVTVFVLGFFMALGKAAVYKHIPVYYPNNVGAVGGLVGMIGGLGGFVLPIAFGALVDLTGLWTSCFMLLFLLVTGSLVWMHMAIRQMERGVVGEALKKLPELPEMQEIHKPEHVGALSGAVLTDWRPEDKTFWETTGRAIARRNLWISIPALLLSFAVWQVWSVVVAKLPSVGFKFTTAELFWLAALPGISGAVLRIFYSFMVPIFGGRLWTTLATWSLLIPADRHRLCRAESVDALSGVPGAGAAVRLRRRQFRLLDGQHLLLLPEGGEGQRARAERRPRQSRRLHRAVRGADHHHGRRVRLVRRRSGDGHQRNADVIAVAAERRLHLGAVHRRQRVRGVVRHERHRFRQGFVRRSGGDLPAQAQLDHVLALYRDLRLLHRLLRRLPAARQDPVPDGRCAAVRLPRTAGRRAVALGDGVDLRQMGRRRASPSGSSS